MAAFSDPLKLSLATLKGEPSFTRVEMRAKSVLLNYQFRDVFRQRLHLSALDSERLQSLVNPKITPSARYKYDPLAHNCSSEIRDLLEETFGGRFNAGAHEPTGAPLRHFASEGLRGRVLPLILLELSGGPLLDRRTSEWERMAFPSGLLRSVETRLGSVPEVLFHRFDEPPETSSEAGRIVMTLCILPWSYWLIRARRRDERRARRAVGATAIGLTLLALVPWLASLSALPASASNWQRWLFLPTDLLLVALPDRLAHNYARLRMVALLVMALLAALGFLPIALLFPLAIASALVLPLAWR
jgi:hypothetical protein